MKTLPEKFSSNGFDFTILERVGDVALLSKRKPNWQPGIEVLEAVVIQRHHGYSIGGNHIPAAESMPRSEAWGKLGLTLNRREDFKSAIAKLYRNAVS